MEAYFRFAELSKRGEVLKNRENLAQGKFVGEF